MRVVARGCAIHVKEKLMAALTDMEHGGPRQGWQHLHTRSAPRAITNTSISPPHNARKFPH